MSLQTITQAEIEKIMTVKEAAKTKKTADAAAIFYKAQEDLYASQNAKEISLRSARRAGQLLSDVEREPGKRNDATSFSEKRGLTPYQESLEGTGITPFVASTWQKLAEIPDNLFEEYLSDLKHARTEFTIKGLIDFVRPFFKLQKRKKQLKDSEKYKALEYDSFKVNDVFLGDIAKIELPENCIDMIFTDPPYDDESLGVFLALSRFAFRSLKPGGYLMTYTGKMFLPQVINALGERLEYVWEYGVFQPDSNHKIQKHHLFQAWRPILCYKKPGATSIKNWQPDMIKGTRNKTFHEWQQQIEPALKWIEAYTNPYDLVVDPFVGGGTTLAACQQLKRNYIGFDKEADAVKITKMRLHDAHI